MPNQQPHATPCPCPYAQKLQAAYYSIPKHLNDFESRQHFLNWATDQTQPNSLIAVISRRFHNDSTYALDLCLTRIDQTQHYSPENCTWQTRDFIRANARDARRIWYHGAIYTIPEFCEEFDVKRQAINYQITKLGLGNITNEVLDAVIAKQRAKDATTHHERSNLE